MNHAIEYCIVHHNTNDNFHKQSVIQLCVGTYSAHNKLFYTLYFAFNTWIADEPVSIWKFVHDKQKIRPEFTKPEWNGTLVYF